MIKSVIYIQLKGECKTTVLASAVTPTSHSKDYSMTPATEVTPTTVLSSAGTPTEQSCKKQYETSLCGKIGGNSSEQRKIRKKTIKRAKIVRLFS